MLEQTACECWATSGSTTAPCWDERTLADEREKGHDQRDHADHRHRKEDPVHASRLCQVGDVTGGPGGCSGKAGNRHKASRAPQPQPARRQGLVVVPVVVVVVPLALRRLFLDGLDRLDCRRSLGRRLDHRHGVRLSPGPHRLDMLRPRRQPGVRGSRQQGDRDCDDERPHVRSLFVGPIWLDHRVAVRDVDHAKSPAAACRTPDFRTRPREGTNPSGRPARP